MEGINLKGEMKAGDSFCLVLPVRHVHEVRSRESRSFAFSGLVAPDEFPCGFQVGFRRRAGRIVFKDGVAEAGRFPEPDGAGNDRLVQHLGQVLFHLVNDLAGKVGAAVVHGHQHPFMPDAGIGSAGADLRRHVQDFGQSFQPEPFALQGSQHFVAGGQGGGHQDSQGGRRIHDAVIIGIRLPQGSERFPEPGQVVAGAGQFYFHAGQVHGGGNDVQPFSAGRQDALFRSKLAEQGRVQAGHVFSVNAHAAGGIGLRIQVNDQDFLLQLGQGGGQVDGRGGFSHSPLLVGDGDDFHSGKGCGEKVA